MAPATLALLGLFFTNVVTAAFNIPNPTGPYAVGMDVHALTNTNLPDPLDPTGTSKSRRVLISRFVPLEAADIHATQPSNVSYMTPAVATAYGQLAAAAGLPNTTFFGFQMELYNLSALQTCSPRGRRGKKFPLVLYGPGSGHSRLLYGARARSLASQGFVVVTVDHPYDANVVEFPDGSIVPGANLPDSNEEVLKKVVKTRQADLSFVLDQLVARFPKHIDFCKVLAVGHSLGGSASAAIASSDKRVLGGINFDGRLVDPVMSAGLKKPFILAGRTNHSSEDPTWNQFWPRLRGPRAELAVSGTQHGSYTDLPTLLNALGLPKAALDQVAPLLGTIDATKLGKILDDVVMAFSRLLFRGDQTPLKNIGATHPEVSSVKNSFN